MIQFKAAFAITFLCYAQGLSPGLQLARVVQNLFVNVAETSDLCIFHDSPNYIWTDFLDDFMPQLAKSLVLNRLNRIGSAQRRCEFHLILLDASLRPVEFNQMVHEYLEAAHWNRYGMFEFVLVEGSRIDMSIFQLYLDFAFSLGIPNSVVIFVTKEGKLPVIFQFEFFSDRRIILDTVDDLGMSLEQDMLLDAFGYQFKALVFNNEPFLFVIPPNQVLGIQYNTFEVFCKHMNATLDLQIGNRHISHLLQITHFLADDSVSVVNTMNHNKKFSELEFTYSQSGICFLVPEKVVGSILYHLLRPYKTSLLVAVLFCLLLLAVLSLLLPKHFPRGICNQLFYGSVIVEYKMLRIERFTLFSFSVILFLLTESYLAKLFQFLFNFQYEPHIESVEDLFATDYIIYSHIPVFITHLNATFPQPNGRFQILSDGDQLLHPDANTVLSTLCHFAESFVLSRQNVDPVSGFLRHYVLPARVPPTTDAYTLSRKQPFSKPFIRVYAELQEAGLLDHWFETLKKYWLALPEDKMQVVEFEQLFSLWTVLATGYGLASVACIAEVVVSRAVALRALLTAQSLYGESKWL